MNNLFPATMLFALLVFPQNLSAQSATHCPMTADDANCVRVVACIGDEGVWFNGRAFGRGEDFLVTNVRTDLETYLEDIVDSADDWLTSAESLGLQRQSGMTGAGNVVPLTIRKLKSG